MIHEFRCNTCKIQYEDYIPPNAPIVSNCHKCGKPALKVFGLAQFNMGEGWPQYNVQAGKTFNSRAEEDRHFESIGAVRADSHFDNKHKKW